MPTPSRRSRPALRTAALALLSLLVLVVVPAPAVAAAADPFPDTIPLPAGFRPEGITSGPGTTFYVGSLADGAIYRGDLRTGEGEVLVPGGGRSTVGLFFDSRTGTLWAAGGPSGTVFAYDAATGAELGRWVVPGSGFLNDLVVTRDAVYVTDSVVPRLVVVPLGARGALPAPDAATTVPLSGDIVYGTGFNANGIRALPDGSLVVAQGNVGALFRVDPATGAADRIEVSGGQLAGGDGLVLRGNRLFVVRGFGGDQVVVLRLQDGGRTAQVVDVLTDPALDVPSTATVAAGRLWAVNARFSTPATPTTPYDVVQLPLRSR